MRAPSLASLSLCAVLTVACGRRSGTSELPEPQPPAGPGADSCAVYVQRVATGVRCTEVDHARCTCELVGAVGEPATQPPLLDPNTPPGDTGVTPPQPPPSGSAATLVFAPGPANATVKCLSGPCPTTTAELITAPYPAIAAAPSGTQIQLEFNAPDHKPVATNYTIYPGTNQIRYTLEKVTIPRPDSATLMFQGAPAGTTVECVSGPCPDKKPHSLETFPAVKLDRDDETLLLRFNAPGYRTGMSSYKVSRGSNIMPVLLEKAPTGKDR